MFRVNKLSQFVSLKHVMHANTAICAEIFSLLLDMLATMYTDKYILKEHVSVI